MKLNDYLKTAKAEGFVRKPFYSAEADTLTYFLEDTEYYAKRLDDLVTVYRSTSDDRFVGCKIKGCRRMIERLGEFDVLIPDGGDYYLGPFFLAGMAEADEDKRPDYEELGRATRGVRIDRRELEPA
jgi:hypothetical protein